MLKKMTAAITVILIILTLGAGGVYLWISGTKLNEDKLRNPVPTLKIYDINDNLIEDWHKKNYTKLGDMSEWLPKSFISIEDKRFYSHNGIDYKRILGAIAANIKSRSASQGASTITQQLIKNTHLTQEKTLARKGKEAYLALKLEKTMSKEDILELYLNFIYFGNSLYGVTDAAKKYFGSSPDELTLSQCAMLAAVIKNPKKYNPITGYNASVERRNLVLSTMLENQFISKDEYDTAINETIVIKNEVNYNYLQSYIDNALHQASTQTGKSITELMYSDMKLYTYLNPAMQRELFERMRSYSDSIPLNDEVSPAKVGVSLDNATHGITAYYNDSGYVDDRLNRQPASLIKPLAIYAPALEMGIIDPHTPIEDTPVNINGYAPENYGGAYRGWISATEALSYSSNAAAVRLMDKIGIQSGRNALDGYGIKTTDKDNSLALALGAITEGVSPIKLAGSYAVLATGRTAEVSFIRYIYQGNGNIYAHNSFSGQLLNSDTVYFLSKMLSECSENGTCKKLRGLGYCAKSGTAAYSDKSMNVDAWIAAYSADTTNLIWLGDPSGAPVSGKITGGSYPAMIMRDYLSALPAPNSIIKPDSIVEKGICKQEYDENHLIKFDDLSDFKGEFSSFYLKNYEECDHKSVSDYDITYVKSLDYLLLDIKCPCDCDVQIIAGYGFLKMPQRKFNGITSGVKIAIPNRTLLGKLTDIEIIIDGEKQLINLD